MGPEILALVYTFGGGGFVRLEGFVEMGVGLVVSVRCMAAAALSLSACFSFASLAAAALNFASWASSRLIFTFFVVKALEIVPMVATTPSPAVAGVEFRQVVSKEARISKPYATMDKGIRVGKLFRQARY
jgi:hypothetical protein